MIFRFTAFFLGLAALAAISPAALAAAPSIKGGKFEVTCKPHAIPDQAIDPIVNFGQPQSAHEHTFFGNRGVTTTSTDADLQANMAGTTCVLPNDTAAYWVPVACDGPCVDATGQATELDPVNVVPPVKIFAYYFGTQGVAVGQYPTDLSMVGGNSHATAPPLDKSVIEFHCGNGGSHSSPGRTMPYDCTAANGVRNTDGVVAVVKFPYCLATDGSVAYGGTGGACPAGDTTLGQVQIHVHYGNGASGFQMGSQLNFTSGPAYTLHGDWMNGWDQAKLQALVSGCLDVNKDCGFLTPSNPGPAVKAVAVAPRVSSCSDSWGADGHTGPWYTGSDQKLHGNTVDISCPGGSTAWKVTYQVGKIVNGTVFFPINETRSGNGSTSFSISTNPVGCNAGAPYYTHVANRVTGGDIYKPSSHGTAIC